MRSSTRCRRPGYPLTDDVNGYRQEGFAKFDRNIRQGRRLERRARLPAPVDGPPEPRGADAYASSSASSSRARAPSASQVGGETIRANEVILCGGAINSPQLLQLSGIGNAAELEPLGVEVVHDSRVSARTCRTTSRCTSSARRSCR